MNMIKKVSLWVLIAGYLAAGINHFYNPASYLRIIPPYIPYPNVANIVSGALEIVLALLLISAKTRPYAAWGIAVLLVAFLPVHITMIADAPLQLGDVTVTPLLAWIRLVLQPVLILWAWWYTNTTSNNKYYLKSNNLFCIVL
ncbi:MAG: MauE/DoxX family redox-associated membrane protein [Mucilaginibacter sp.]